MKKTFILLAALAVLLLAALPAAADLGYEEPTVSPTEEETEEPEVLPTEEETEEPVVEEEEEVAEQLAVTGADAMTIGLVGGGLLLAGGTALVATRRSKANPSE